MVPEVLRSKVRVFVELYRMNRQLSEQAAEREALARSVMRAQPTTAPAIHSDALPARKAGRILVVDDLVAAAETLTMLLEMVGFEVRTATEGATALQIADEFRPDVVLLDIGLPGMNGFEVANRLRSLPSCSEVLLIALTGYGEADSRSRSTQAGFDFHMVKPADVSLLLTILANPNQARRDQARAH